jgi:hypothetical protein
MTGDPMKKDRILYRDSTGVLSVMVDLAHAQVVLQDEGSS